MGTKFKLFLVLVLTLFIVGNALAEEEKLKKNPNENIAAVINGVVITKSMLFQELNKILPLTTYHRRMPQGRQSELMGEAMNNIIMAELKYTRAKKLGIKIDDDDIEKGLDKIKNNFKSRREFKKTLKKSKMVVADLEKMVEKGLLIKEITTREQKHEVHVTDKDIEDYYNNNKEKFVKPEERRLRHIMLKVDPSAGPKKWKESAEKAKKILEMIKAGEDFAELATEVSDDKSSVNGGELGFVHSGQLLSEVNSETFKLKKGEVTGVIKTLYGYHILKLEDIKEKKQQSFDEINKDMLKRDLKRKMIRDKKTAWVRSLKEGADIKIFIKDITLPED